MRKRQLSFTETLSTTAATQTSGDADNEFQGANASSVFLTKNLLGYRHARTAETRTCTMPTPPPLPRHQEKKKQQKPRPSQALQPTRHAPTRHIQYGWHSVSACLHTTPTSVNRLFILKSHKKHTRTLPLLAIAHKQGIPVTFVDKQWLHLHYPSQVHQGIIAQCGPAQQAQYTPSLPHRAPPSHPPSHTTLESLKPLLSAPLPPPLLLVLDGVQDPHNLGACLRTALAAQATAVIIPQRRAVGLTATVHKVACGATAHLPVITVTNLSRTLDWLKKEGVWIYGTAETGSHSLFNMDLTQGPIAWVLGAEGNGLRALTAKKCDFLVRIPTHHAQSSLNVSVASGICCFETRRQQSW